MNPIVNPTMNELPARSSRQLLTGTVIAATVAASGYYTKLGRIGGGRIQ